MSLKLLYEFIPCKYSFGIFTEIFGKVWKSPGSPKAWETFKTVFEESTEVCYDIIETKNTYTKACSDDFLSFIFMAIETHSSFLLSFGQLALPFHPMSLSMIVPAAWSLDLACRHQICIEYLVSFVYEFRPLAFMSCCYTS